MEELKNELFDLIEKFDSGTINQEQLNTGFIASISSNNRCLDEHGRIPYLIDLILNDQIFE